LAEGAVVRSLYKLWDQYAFCAISYIVIDFMLRRVRNRQRYYYTDVYVSSANRKQFI